MKKNLLFFTIMFCVAVLWAQENSNPLSNEEFFTQSELVIEGQFTKIVHTYDTKGNGKFEDCIAIEEILVKKVYKGDTSLAGELIYLTRVGTSVGAEKIYSNETWIDEWGISITSELLPSYRTPKIFYENEINYGVSSFTPKIYFLKRSDLLDDNNTKYHSYKKYMHIYNILYGIRSESYNYMFVCDNINVIAGLDNLIFYNRKDFYDYMKQFEGFNASELVFHYEMTQNERHEAYLDSLRAVHKVDVDFMNNLLKNECHLKDFQKKESKKKVSKKSKNSKRNIEYSTLTLQMANFKEVSSDGKKYVEFDILGQSENQVGNKQWCFHLCCVLLSERAHLFKQ